MVYVCYFDLVLYYLRQSSGIKQFVYELQQLHLPGLWKIGLEIMAYIKEYLRTLDPLEGTERLGTLNTHLLANRS